MPPCYPLHPLSPVPLRQFGPRRARTDLQPRLESARGSTVDGSGAPAETRRRRTGFPFPSLPRLREVGAHSGDSQQRCTAAGGARQDG
ncbi:hypothetical protein E2562_032950 [Oryza meyeriana var. granulata]|uniref:Uncharacterized protein n=1 Tax=Oryza meyeriana var. granulata TaxID=110450 RepID=A0A6G1D9X2_9ORYZ|nr:hypothetical protein E2562_032950 [Oryza meyeriana var. granulata]KAF0909238.1 hypothetical protein E2562_032950 [Oryza meyeriana var. granulata]